MIPSTENSPGNSTNQVGTVKKEYDIKTIAKTKVSLWLDEYDNLFSDFDPRPHSHRELSDDFINEVKKITADIKPETLELIFLIPRGHKNLVSEHVIKERIHNHFKKTETQLEKEIKDYLHKGMISSFVGIILMLLATVISYFENGNLLLNLGRVILEPAGWFTTWFGLDHIFYLSKEDRKELEFTKKMAKTNISFDVY